MFTMFRLEGGELLDRVLCGDPWTESDAAHIVSQLCDALDYLHSPYRRLVHADIRVGHRIACLQLQLSIRRFRPDYSEHSFVMCTLCRWRT